MSAKNGSFFMISQFFKKILSLTLILAMVIYFMPGFGSAVKAGQNLAQFGLLSDVKIVQASGGYGHFMGLDREGYVWSWGRNDYGQLGDGSKISKSVPVKINGNGSGIPKMKYVNAGNTSLASGAIDVQGNIWTWGFNYYNILGNNGTALSGISLTPQKVNSSFGGNKIVSLVFGEPFAAALDESGNVWTWGLNYYGVFGTGNFDSQLTATPQKVTSISNIVKLEAGKYHLTALRNDGKVFSWGYNVEGELGDNTLVNKAAPVEVTTTSANSPMPPIKDIANLWGTSMAVDTSGNLYMWGFADGSNTIPGVMAVQRRPYKVNLGGVKVKSITTGGGLNTTVVDENNEVWSWGYNAEGQLGNGLIGTNANLYNISQTVTIAAASQKKAGHGLPAIDQVVPAPHELLLLDFDGNLWSAGWNLFGGLGIGSSTYFNSQPGYVIFPAESIKMNLTSSRPDNIKIYKPDTAKLTVHLTVPIATTLDSIRYFILDDEFDQTVVDSKAQFDSLYNTAAKKGSIPASAAVTFYLLPENVGDNGKVWVMAEGHTASGSALDPNITAFASHSFQNFYTPVKVFIKGVTDSGMLLYNNRLVQKPDGSQYGVYVNWNGTVNPNPPLGVDTLTIEPLDDVPYAPYWRPTNSGHADKPLADDSFLAAPGKTYTFTYAKDTSYWYTVKYNFELEELGSYTAVDADINGAPTSEIIQDYAIPDNGQLFALDPYTPPQVYGQPDYVPIGYKLNGGPLVECVFPNGFNPVVSSGNETITIVYVNPALEGIFTVTERYINIETGEDLLPSLHSNITSGGQYASNPPHIENFVAVNWELDGGTQMSSLATDINSNIQDLISTGMVVSGVSANHQIAVHYMYDSNNNLIPDQYEKNITVNYLGVYVDLTETLLKSEHYSGWDGDTVSVSPDGIIPGAAPAQWILQSQFAPTLTYTLGVNVNEEILYDYDSNGNGIPDKNEGTIYEHYEDIYGSPIALSTTINELVENIRYEKSAPRISGYVAVNWKLDGAVQGSGTKNEIEDGISAVIDLVSTSGHVVVFIYMADQNGNGIPNDMEAEAVFKWVGKTVLNTEVELFRVTITDFDGDTVTVKESDAKNYGYNMDPKWRFDLTGSGQSTFNAVLTAGAPQEFIFKYNEGVFITVKGFYSKGTPEERKLYEYGIYKATSDNVFSVTAFEQMGYKIAEALLDGVPQTSGQAPAVVRVNPQNGSQTVEFLYASNMAPVRVEAYYFGATTPVEAFTPYSLTAEAGKPFICPPPVIQGFTLAGAYPQDGQIGSVNESGDVVRFYYKKNTGHLIIVAVDSGSSQEIGRIYSQIGYGESIDTSPANAPAAGDIPYLANYGAALGAGMADYLFYDGVNDVTLTYQYSRKVRTVTVKYLDVDSGALIIPAASQPKGVGQGYTIFSEDIPNYTLLSPLQQTVYVGNDSGTDIEVVFFYRQNQAGEFRVLSYEDKNGNGTFDLGEELYSFTQTGAVGSSVRVTAPYIYGYILNDTSSKYFTPTGGLNDILTFRYEKDVWNVTVSFLPAGISPPSHFPTALEVIKGESVTMTAPYISGYKAVGSVIGNEPQTGDISFRITPAGNVTVKLVYETLDGGILQGFAPVEIRHVDKDNDGALLFAETVMAPVNSVYNAVPLNPVKYPGYKWVGGDNQIFVKGSQLNQIVLEYTSTAAILGNLSVRHMARTVDGREWLLSVESKSGLPLGAFTYNLASEGVVQSYLLEGYTLVTVSHPQAVIGSDGFIDVFYRPLSANVSVAYKDVTTPATLEQATVTAYVGEWFAPAVKSFTGFTFKDLSPADGVNKVRKTGNVVSVNYTKNADNETGNGNGDGTSGGNGGGAVTEKATLVILCRDENGNSIWQENRDVAVNSTETVYAPEIAGYTLADLPAKTIKIVSGENKIEFLYRKSFLIPLTGDHIRYIYGYGDGTVKPEGQITRAETAAMLFMLVEAPDKNDWVKGAFIDIQKDKWYAQAVNYLAEHGVISGYPEKTYKPEQKITRGEFTTLIALLGNLKQGGSNTFTDLSSDHWAKQYIDSAYSSGLIKGYPNGTFRPDGNITRAEAIAIVNSLVNRRIETKDIPKEVKGYTDLDKTHWAYGDILEASTSHDFTRKENGFEQWDKISE